MPADRFDLDRPGVVRHHTRLVAAGVVPGVGGDRRLTVSHLLPACGIVRHHQMMYRMMTMPSAPS